MQDVWVMNLERPTNIRLSQEHQESGETIKYMVDHGTEALLERTFSKDWQPDPKLPGVQRSSDMKMATIASYGCCSKSWGLLRGSRLSPRNVPGPAMGLLKYLLAVCPAQTKAAPCWASWPKAGHWMSHPHVGLILPYPDLLLHPENYLSLTSAVGVRGGFPSGAGAQCQHCQLAWSRKHALLPAFRPLGLDPKPGPEERVWLSVYFWPINNFLFSLIYLCSIFQVKASLSGFCAIKKNIKHKQVS